MEEKEVLEMKLFEEIRTESGDYFIKVPGGWIFQTFSREGNGSAQTVSNCFVPIKGQGGRFKERIFNG